MRRILVAGIGNVFLGDDGFGVEVLRRLSSRPQPDGVELADFGIRGFDLAYELMDGWEAAVLVDALPRGAKPGTVFVLEPDLEQLDAMGIPDGHGMSPVEVFRLIKQLGGSAPRIYLVGCEPASLGGEQGEMGLSEPVAGALPEAVGLVESLVGRLAAGAEVEV